MKHGIRPNQPFCDPNPAAPPCEAPLTDLDETCVFAIEATRGYATENEPLVLTERDELDVTLSYKSLSNDAPAPQELLIETNDRSRPSVIVRLSVRSGNPQLVISSDSIAFPAGSESTKGLLFRNTGSTELAIGSLRIVPLTDVPVDEAGNPVAEFSVLENELPEPFTIAPNGSQEVRIRYSPQDDGSDEAQFVVTSNSNAGSTQTVFLTSGSLSSEIVAQQPHHLCRGDTFTTFH